MDKKYDYLPKDLIGLARASNGLCITKSRIAFYQKAHWVCDKGHEWLETPSNIEKGKWCPTCAFSETKLEDMYTIADFKDGKCLSHRYIDEKHPLKWECKFGHTWEAPYYIIHKGKWCPTCDKKKMYLDRYKKIAIERGGKCLSHEYIGSTSKLEWQCEKGHKWMTRPANIKSGSWCPECAGVKKKTIKDMHDLAKMNNGKCLSKKYVNLREKLTWQCEKGHKWEATASYVNSGAWCPYCTRKSMAIRSISNVHELAKINGGSFVSEEYVSGSEKLTWRCNKGHKWQDTPASIQDGAWCPQCN
ncbi:MAG: hypothetical protein GY909_15805 [Oligoflexia bacterium]|nr:hypothetical protein [Oligoflexia bacterium]